MPRSAFATRSAFGAPFGGARLVKGSGGYTYKVYADGRVQIVESPRGGGGSFVQPGTAAYEAIMAEVGASSGRRRKVSGDQVLETTERILGVGERGVTVAERIQAMIRGETPGAPEDALAIDGDFSVPPPTLTQKKGPSVGLLIGGGLLFLVLGGGLLALLFGGRR